MSTLPVTTPPVATADRPAERLVTFLGLILTFLLSAPVWIGALADVSNPLGVPPHVWVYATAGTAAGTALVRYLIALVGKIAAQDPSSPSVGIATYLGIGMTGLSGLPALLAELDQATNPLNVDPQVWIKAGLIVAAATAVGRVAQDAVATWYSWRGGEPVLETPPTGGTGTEEPPPVVPDPPPGEPPVV